MSYTLGTVQFYAQIQLQCIAKLTTPLHFLVCVALFILLLFVSLVFSWNHSRCIPRYVHDNGLISYFGFGRNLWNNQLNQIIGSLPYSTIWNFILEHNITKLVKWWYLLHCTYNKLNYKGWCLQNWDTSHLLNVWVLLYYWL